MVAAAVIGAAVVSAGAAAVTSSDASRQASHTAADAANQAAQIGVNQQSTIRQDLLPYQQAGQTALNPLLALSGMQGSDKQQQILQNMPGYQFTRDQGLLAVQNSAAARGLGSSGAALRGAADYSTGLAQKNYGDYWNQLMGISQLGQNAAAQTGAYGTQTAANVGQNLITGGQALGAGYLGQANAINNSVNNLSGLYMTNQLLNNNGMNGYWNTNAAQTPPQAYSPNYGIGGPYGPTMSPTG